jgi:hypothetical protein
MYRRLSPLKVLWGTLGYLLLTFPLAYVWHLVLFAPTYERLGYFTTEPIVAFGFGAILLQGILLSVIYPSLCAGKSLLSGAMTFAIVMGGYHWTIHVLAEAAKHAISPLPTWFALETCYLVIQFTLGGFLFSWIYRQRGTVSGKQSP